MEKNVAIVHYNTPELTVAAIKSLWRNTPDCKVTVFDNSDERPFSEMQGVTVIDNTKGQFIDFERLLDRFPDKLPTPSNWGSEKHIASVEMLFSFFPDGFVLMDSDVLVKKDISEFFDTDVIYAGETEKPQWESHARRVLPMLLWINVPMCNKHDIHFYHEGMVFHLTQSAFHFDTGGSFITDVERSGLPVKTIKIYNYIEHFGSGSWKTKGWRGWLEQHKYLFEDMEKEKTQKKSVKDKILVVIPYCSQGAQGREIEYAVAGWRKHFKEDYLIVLAGEDHPVTKTGDDIMCIESKRVEPIQGMYRQHLDYVSCFKKVHNAFPDSKGFIFVADDVYAVNDFDMSDVLTLKQKADVIQDYVAPLNGWQKDKIRTRELLKREGYPIRNFTTHLPQYFEWDKMEALWDKYDMEHNSYVIEDLYYNIYYPTRIPLTLHIDHDNFKCGVYRPNPRMNYIYDAFKKKIWIQNSVEGWIPALDKILSNYYGI